MCRDLNVEVVVQASIEYATDRALMVRFQASLRRERPVTRLFQILFDVREELQILALRPAYDSLLIEFQQCQKENLEHARILIEEKLAEFQVLSENKGHSSKSRSAIFPEKLIEIPVVYGAEESLDLDFVARATGMSREQLIKKHSEALYQVEFLGFAPGFAYLSGLPSELRVPRKSTPRLKVPRGAVAIAGEQAGIYPEESAGGWQILGKTDLQLFNPERSPASLLSPGDRVKFIPVPAAEHAPFLRETHLAHDQSQAGYQIEILSGGFQASLQDEGRRGLTHLGVSPGGAADPMAMVIANRLVGNSDHACAIEMAAMGASLKFHVDTWIALTGGVAALTLDGHSLSMWTSYKARAGDSLRIGAIESGLRVYLAVDGGVECESLLGSRSTNLGEKWGGFQGRELVNGDFLNKGTDIATAPGLRRARSSVRKFFGSYESDHCRIRILRGAQWNWLSEKAQRIFTTQSFQVTAEANRRGIRLEGIELERADEFAGNELVTEGVSAGTIQVPQGGQPLILFCEQQTTGGYPKAAEVITADLWRLGQLRPGSYVSFEMVDLERAWDAKVQLDDALKHAIQPY